MKKIYFALSVFCTVMATASAQVTLDFEDGGNGANMGWNVFENDTNPALEFVANPNGAAPNTSAKTAKYTTLIGGQPWAGTETQDGAITPFTLNASNCIVKLMVYKSVISDVGVKFTQVGGGSMPEIKVANTLVNQWEELTFDFSGQIAGTPNQVKNIVIFPDFPPGGPGSREYASVTYFDNMTFTAGEAPELPDEPTVAAPNPTFEAGQVISLFSGVYTNQPVESWQTPWSTGVLQEVTIAGNAAKKYVNLGFVGVDIGIANQVDATGMTHFNVDVWSPNFPTFGVKLVDFGADGQFGGGDDVEHQVDFADLAQNEWHTLHIPLENFTNLTTRAHISQILFLSEGGSIAYVDNVFFSTGDEPEIPEEPLTAAPDPTLPQDDVISMFSGVYANVPVDTWKTDWSAATYEEVAIDGNATKKYTNLNFVGIETAGANQIDATGMTHFNVSVWSPNFTILKIKLVDFGANGAYDGPGMGDDKEHEMTYNTPAQGQWITYNIPLSDMAGLSTRANIAQLIFATTDGTATLYVDNVYFSAEEVIMPEGPATAAPDPTLPQAQVISMFSGMYDNVTIENWQAPWSTGSQQDMAVEGNATKKYSNLGYVGIDIGVANVLDITGMTHINAHVWLDGDIDFGIKLVDFGANGVWNGGGDDVEDQVGLTDLAHNTWVAVRIPLSEFEALTTREHIAQMLIMNVMEGGTGTAYVDNIYFSTEAAGTEEFIQNKVAMYPNPANDVLHVLAGAVIEDLTVYNTLGQLVFSSKPHNTSAKINVSSLDGGMYIVNTVVNGVVKTQKFIKK